jgi:hypothetical protein
MPESEKIALPAVAQRPNVIACTGGTEAKALQSATREIPIVLLQIGFPLSISCALCNHSAVLPLAVAKDLPDDATTHDVALRLRCTKCARPRGGSVQPHPRLWIAHLRQTGQRHCPAETSELPYR